MVSVPIGALFFGVQEVLTVVHALFSFQVEGRFEVYHRYFNNSKASGSNKVPGIMMQSKSSIDGKW